MLLRTVGILMIGILTLVLTGCAGSSGSSSSGPNEAMEDTNGMDSSAMAAQTSTGQPNNDAHNTLVAQSDETLADRPPPAPDQPIAPNAWEEDSTGFPIPTSIVDEDGDGFYTTIELEQAIKEIYPYYTWPTAYHPTVDDILSGFVLFGIIDNSGHEAPGEHAWIGNVHQCAWQLNWMDAYVAGDQKEMDLSMDQLRNVTLNNPFKQLTTSYYSDIYDKAELGDPAQLRQLISESCNYPYLNTASCNIWSFNQLVLSLELSNAAPH